MTHAQSIHKYIDAHQDIQLDAEDDDYIYFITDNIHHIFILSAMHPNDLQYQERKDSYRVRIKKN